MMMMQGPARPLLLVFLCLQIHAAYAFGAYRRAFHSERHPSPPLFDTSTCRPSATGSSNTGEDTNVSKSKRIVLIRHGCTHMNEYLSVPGSRWGDANFTDIFDPSSEAHKLFRDSPLSERGIRQAQRLSARLGHLLEGGRPGADIDFFLDPRDQNVMNEIDLIAVSPLTRALQTTEIALLPHIDPLSSDPLVVEDVGDASLPPKRQVPVVALPLASERVYLISDMGRTTQELSQQYPYVDFANINHDKDSWWFTLENDENYVEWRPNGEGQKYACLGEPEVDFNRRMTALYDWLAEQEAMNIALICHYGVIDWLIGEDFENCEMRVVDFASMKRTGFMLSDEEATQVFAQGERCVVRDTE